jgi:methyl-accepting chemotaxis protein
MQEATLPAAARAATIHEAAHRSTDRLLGRVLLAHAPVALALAPVRGTWTAACLGVALSLWAFLLTRARPGRTSTRLATGAALMGYSAIFIHQAGGLVEAHFHVFAGLAFLLSYRDWRVPVAAAATIAVHHIAFFFLQRAGFPVALLNHQHGFWIVALHAAMVAFETSILVHLSVQMRRSDQATQQVFDAADAVAAGDLRVDLGTAGSAGSFGRLLATLRALEGETEALATRVRTGRAAAAAPRGAGAAELRGAFADMMRRLDAAAAAADALHAESSGRAQRAAAFVDELRSLVERLRERDLRGSAPRDRAGEYADVSRALDEALGQLADALREVDAATGDIVEATGRIADRSSELAHASAEQAGQLDGVAERLRGLGVLSARSSDGADQARALVAEARSATASGVDQMRRLASAVGQISASVATPRRPRSIRTFDGESRSDDTDWRFIAAARRRPRAGDRGARLRGRPPEEVRALACAAPRRARQTSALFDD